MQVNAGTSWDMQVNAGGQLLGALSSWSGPAGSGNEFDRPRYGVLGGVFGRRVQTCHPGRSFLQGERRIPPDSELKSGRWIVSASGCRASGQVGHAPQAQLLGAFFESLPAAREKTAQETTVAQLLQPRLPVIRAAAQTVENLGHFARERRLPLAKKPPGIIHQEQVVAQRESGYHPFTRRTELAPILDRAEPVRLLQSRCCCRTRHAAGPSRFQILGPPLGLDVIDTLFDRCVCAGFGNVRDPRRNRVQINRRTGRQQRLFVDFGSWFRSSPYSSGSSGAGAGSSWASVRSRSRRFMSSMTRLHSLLT
jgi:hypothetical protein